MKIKGKRAEVFKWQFTHSNDAYLCEVYTSYSDAKARAYERCLNKCLEQGGYNFCILSHNTFCFTVGWITENMYMGSDGEAHSKYILHVETPHNSYEMEY